MCITMDNSIPMCSITIATKVIFRVFSGQIVTKQRFSINNDNHVCSLITIKRLKRNSTTNAGYNLPKLSSYHSQERAFPFLHTWEFNLPNPAPM